MIKNQNQNKITSNGTKKIISFSLLTLFLFSLFLPINVSAIGGWYFANNPLFTNANAFVSPSGYTNEKLCNDALTAKISEDFLNNLKNINYSKCVLIEKNNAKTSDVIAKDPLPWKTVQELYVIPTALSSLIVNATKLNLGINESSTITVTTSPKKSEVKINFSLSNDNGSLDKTTCTTDTNGSCNVSFTALKNGAYGIGCYTTSHPEYKNCSSVAGTISVTAFTTFTSTTSEEAKTKENYYPLATLPGLGETCAPSCDAEGNCKTTCVKIAPNCTTVDGKEVCTPSLGFAGYLNIMIKIFIGICAILAMIMIVMGGIQYMTSGLVSNKQAAKETIMNAIFGLLLALGAFAILNTINPDLVSVGLQNLPTATLTVKTVGDESKIPGKTNALLYRDDYDLSGTYNKPAGNLSDCIKGATGNLKSITVHAGQWKQNGDTVSTRFDFDNKPCFDYAGIGWKGYSKTIEENKTPIGNWTMTGNNSISTSQKAAIKNTQGINMGSAYFPINITGATLGIYGIHGQSDNRPGSSAGCVKLKNDDLLLLAPYMKAGVKLIITDK